MSWKKRRTYKKWSRRKTFTSIPKHIYQELNNLSELELLAKEEEFKKELKEVRSFRIKLGKKRKQVFDDNDKNRKEVRNIISKKILNIFPERKKSVVENIFWENKKKKEIREELISFLIVCIEQTLAEPDRDQDSMFNRRNYLEILPYKANLFNGELEKLKIDIKLEQIKIDKLGRNWKFIYAWKGTFADKVFDSSFYNFSDQLSLYVESSANVSKFLNDEYRSKNKLGLLESLISSIPSHIKRSKQDKKKARLAMYDSQSREVGSEIARKVRRKSPDPFICPYCCSTTMKKNSHVDHINPISNGGLSLMNNMVLVCSSCNLKKRDHSLLTFCKRNKIDFKELTERLFKLGKWI